MNIKEGRDAIEKVISSKSDVMNAMRRDDIGDISFLWGIEGKGEKLKGGYEVSHIIAGRKRDGIKKHGMTERQAEAYALEVARKMPEVIGLGTTSAAYGPEGAERINIEHDGHTAVLSKAQKTSGDRWLLTGWESD